LLKETVYEFIVRHRLLEPSDRVLVAVSGGPDSLCLLHLLKELAPRLGYSLVVASLDHRFRPESREELETVRRLAESWGLPFTGASMNVPGYRARHKLSAQEAARRLRYGFLRREAARFKANKVAVGHHRDDQLETVLHNLLRGTGVDGLAGMKPKRLPGKATLIRPLLAVSRQEIEAYCREHQLEPAADPSNRSTVYTRNRIRLELIPFLEERYNPRIREALWRLSQSAEADRRLLSRLAEHQFRKLARPAGGELQLDREALNRLPEALGSRVVRLALRRLSLKEAGWEHVQRLLQLSREGGSSWELPLPGGGKVLGSYRTLLFSAAPPAATGLTAVPLQVPGETEIPGTGGVIEAALSAPEKLPWPPPPQAAYLDYRRLPGSLWVRSRWPGARFHPQGAPGTMKLKKFLIDQKVPRRRRDRLPLVTCGEEIIWVAGLRIADPYRITKDTREVLLLRYREQAPGEEK